MRLLVTGGAGYLGSILVPRLLSEGYHLKVIDSFLYHQTPLLDYCFNPNLEIINGDVRDSDLLRRSLRDCDFILPLACLTGAPLCQKNPLDARLVNYEAVENILKWRSPGQKIIFPTTNSGYGTQSRELDCTEETPLHPISLYGKLKVEIEEKILSAGESITLRLATVFGSSPRMRLDLLVNDFVHKAYFENGLLLFEPHFKRNFIHIRDVAEAFYFSIVNFERLKNQAYNVGLNEANLSKLELCQKIKQHLPDFHYQISDYGRDPDQRNYIVSNEKINKAGFAAKVSLDLGIGELIKSFQVLSTRALRNC